eukprot:12148170-Alexandrium_andersonii.AAC.2
MVAGGGGSSCRPGGQGGSANGASAGQQPDYPRRAWGESDPLPRAKPETASEQGPQGRAKERAAGKRRGSSGPTAHGSESSRTPRENCNGFARAPASHETNPASCPHQVCPARRRGRSPGGLCSGSAQPEPGTGRARRPPREGARPAGPGTWSGPTRGNPHHACDLQEGRDRERRRSSGESAKQRTPKARGGRRCPVGTPRRHDAPMDCASSAASASSRSSSRPLARNSPRPPS